MPNNPFVKPPSADKRIMPSRTALYPSASIPAGETLNNWQPEELVDGAICFVLAEVALYRFDKFSVAAPATNVTVTTIKGVGVPGRWRIITAPSSDLAYMALSYASPNSLGAAGIIGVDSLVAATWTEFQDEVNGVVLASNGDITWDGDKAIIVGRDMVVEIDWFLSWYIVGAEEDYQWEGACLLNGVALQTPVPGSICSDYYVPGADNDRNSVMTGSTIVSLAENDTLELMVNAPVLAIPQTVFRAQYGVLAVVELCSDDRQ
jgi:hypothetical protein